MRLPFVFRSEFDRIRELFFDELDDLNQALAANGDLRRRVASLELENSELRRQLEERDAGRPER